MKRIQLLGCFSFCNDSIRTSTEQGGSISGTVGSGNEERLYGESTYTRG